MGRLLRMSSTRVRLVDAMYPASTLVIGLIAVRFGDVMREPVTTTSSRPALEAAAALEVVAVCDQAAGTTAVAAAAASAARTANCNFLFVPMCCSLTKIMRSTERSSEPLPRMCGLNHVDELLPTRPTLCAVHHVDPIPPCNGFGALLWL